MPDEIDDGPVFNRAKWTRATRQRVFSLRPCHDRMRTCILEGAISRRVDRAVLPRLEVAGNKRLLRLRQVQAVRKIEQLLQGKVGDLDAVLIRLIKHEVGNCPWIMCCHSSWLNVNILTLFASIVHDVRVIWQGGNDGAAGVTRPP